MAHTPVSAEQHYNDGLDQLNESGRMNLDRTERQILAARAQANFMAGILVTVFEQIEKDAT